MKTQLLIQLLKDQPNMARWVRIEPGQGATPVAHGSLQDLANQSVGAQIIVLVPGTDVAINRVSVPKTNKQKMLKAIPFALEDHIADNVDDMHFALGERDADGQVTTVAVARDKMDEWNAQLTQAGIHAHAIVPDVLSIKTEEACWTLLTDGGYLYINSISQPGMLIDLENAAFMLNLVLGEDNKETPERLVFYGDEVQGQQLNPGREDIEYEIRPHQGGLMEFLVHQQSGVDLTVAINLLQGDYSRREQFGKLWRPWRFAASLAAVWFVLQLGVSIYDVSVLEGEKDALQQEIEKVYRSAFPKTKKIVNAKVQMQRELDALRGGGGGGSDVGFLNLLADSGDAFRQTSGLVLRSVRYKNNSLDVELEVGNLQVLDQLKQKLMADSKLKVEIQSAASRDNKVQGRISIKRNS